MQRSLVVPFAILGGCCCCLSTGAEVQNVIVRKRYPPLHANYGVRVYLPMVERNGVRVPLPIDDFAGIALRPQLEEAPPHEVLATIDVDFPSSSSTPAVECAKQQARELGGDGLIVLATNLPHSDGGLFGVRWRFLAIRRSRG